MTNPLIWWVRRDLRLRDNPLLVQAVVSGRAVVPVFILDAETEALGAAAKWRLGLSVAAFARDLEAIGSRLVLRRGPALEVLRGLVAEVGAGAVHWARLYDPASVARDTAVKAALRSEGLEAVSHAGHLLFEPWTVATGQGGFYKVYTPFWRSVKDRDVAGPSAAPRALLGPQAWPASDDLADWRMGAAMNRGAGVVAVHACVGEAAAQARLAAFLDGPVGGYKERRDFPAEAATSRLSENLTYGEIGPRDVWHGGMRALQDGRAGAEHFLKELVWREFAYHLLHHTPHITTQNWRPEWDNFAWRGDGADAERWRRGMTGEPFVDAAMREMYVTGTMHNRARMIVASYLTKHLLTDWRVGLRWFEECLIDWDPAANAMGWQWAAGSGPDAALYFRVFNPETQVEKFDPKAVYRHRFIAELANVPGRDARAFFDAVPRAWGLDAGAPYPRRMVDLAVGRKRALEAYAQRNSGIDHA
ncbi:deoxyribodipyrimidine photo-lyase [Pseudorhodobacter antarcticus]|uniref:Deoxyribodipyrimidine photo-lyase n=1 Tax=Pseudorhodobacter antarcticus TaxID=1077947 RepID=A0A1H8LA80_9RHOB|nr:deoxyribodipyrimidine photo-lyase [Pseudorhodobacter antarcticus]SEO02023.1 deoxyribodipyrimidine photo-lyase [Pseudorhodobacter antarcticus]